ncbi:MAG: PTS fructose transporter subunit IIA [Burkholderiales bacterium]|nr:PTS fructose transporter subunit IIA [Burkholderiales bacterium]
MTAVLIVAHAPLATALQAVARHVYADCGHPVLALDVPPAATAEAVRAQARALMDAGSEADWLVLTDVFGATPCNAVQALADDAHVRVVCGVNVPMLWRALCYAGESLEALAERAVVGATQGVMPAASTRPQNQKPSATGRDPNDDHHQQ